MLGKVLHKRTLAAARFALDPEDRLIAPKPFHKAGFWLAAGCRPKDPVTSSRDCRLLGLLERFFTRLQPSESERSNKLLTFAVVVFGLRELLVQLLNQKLQLFSLSLGNLLLECYGHRLLEQEAQHTSVEGLLE